MSVQTELQRIIQAKADIIDSIEAKGVTVPAGTKIDGLDEYVDQIQQGGGPTPEPTPWAADECFHIDLIETDQQYGFVLIYLQEGSIRKRWDELPFNAYYQRTAIDGTPSDSNWILCSDSKGNVPTLDNNNYRRVWLKIENPLGYKRFVKGGTGVNWQIGFYNLANSKITTTSTKIELGGNLMSLLSIYKDVDLPSQAFNNFFSGNTLQMAAANLIFPNTTSEGCYCSMFLGCTNLTTTPALPATTLAPYCYYYMFGGCTNLTTTPALPATALAPYCYNYMFNNCKVITSTPALLATTLYERSYAYMFNGCTALTTIQTISATTLAKYACQCMFNGCTALVTGPVLPALTLEEGCYRQMFNGCTNLNYIKAMFTTLSTGNTFQWLSGVAATGTFVKNVNATWTDTGVSAVPDGWTVETAAV